MKRTTKTKVVRIGDDKGGTNESGYEGRYGH